MTRCLTAGDVFPSLRLPVLIEEDAVSDTARMAGEELEVPRLRARSESLQSLWISEPTNQFILVHATDARLEIFDLWLMPTGHYEETEEGQGKQVYGGGSTHGL
jgi:hypothetical protein